MDKYKLYLGEQILTGDEVITYRSLSRTLKVHVNLAKQMLFEFHKWQNQKRPGSVHATYLIYGVKKDASGPQSQPDGDVEMTSSLPVIEEAEETVPTFTMSLVKEEELNDVLADYENVSSIHIYSLGPHEMKDMVMLSDVARQVTALNLQEDATKTGSVYGTITNPGVRRRERKGAGARLAAAPPTAAVAEMAAKKSVATERVKEEVSETTRKETITTAPAAKKPTPALKRAGSSGLAQAFAKAAAMPKKAPAAKVATPAAKDEDQHMSDDGEDDDEAQPRPTSGAVLEGSRTSRKDREEALRRMMDEDDEEEEAEAAPKEESGAEEEEPPAEEAPAPVEKEEPTEEVDAPSGDGRRRGRRRVMKKKQVMDDQGYLVTQQEPGWESFSEDEKPAVTATKRPSSSAPAPAANKPKKSGPKGSQGNIMSFFGKK